LVIILYNRYLTKEAGLADLPLQTRIQAALVGVGTVFIDAAALGGCMGPHGWARGSWSRACSWMTLCFRNVTAAILSGGRVSTVEGALLDGDTDHATTIRIHHVHWAVGRDGHGDVTTWETTHSTKSWVDLSETTTKSWVDLSEASTKSTLVEPALETESALVEDTSLVVEETCTRFIASTSATAGRFITAGG